MISGSITPERVPKKLLFLRYHTSNNNRLLCQCDGGAAYVLERREDEIVCLDAEAHPIARLEAPQQVLRKSYIHKRIELRLVGGSLPSGAVVLEKGRRFLEIEGAIDVLTGNIPDDNSNRFCRYAISLNCTKIDFTCFEDRNLPAVLLGIYATFLQVTSYNNNPT
jgi:hypothetical protein